VIISELEFSLFVSLSKPDENELEISYDEEDS
jgi:hypothetical protein